MKGHNGLSCNYFFKQYIDLTINNYVILISEIYIFTNEEDIMSLNSPAGDTNNISFGPAKVFLGEWKARDSNGKYLVADGYTGAPKYTGEAGITPAIDVGYIGEDGVSLELTSEKRNIVQGNPQLILYSFVTTQAATFTFSSIEWDFDNFRLALGAGSTSDPTDGSATAGSKYYSFGGNPLNTVACMRMVHKMAVTNNNMIVYAWKVQSKLYNAAYYLKVVFQYRLLLQKNILLNSHLLLYLLTIIGAVETYLLTNH